MKNLLVLCFIFFAAKLALAQTGLLWKVSGNDLKQASYVFGTIHLIDSAHFFWPDQTLAKLSESSSLVTELPVDLESMDMSNLMAMMGSMMMGGDTTIQMLLSAQDYKLLEAKLSKQGLPVVFLQKLKPLFIQMLLSIDMSENNSVSKSTKSYELELVSLAKENEMELKALETADYQMSLFDSVPLQMQVELLEAALHPDTSLKVSELSIYDVYVSQNLDSLVALVSSDEMGLDSFDRLFINNRNRNWIPLMVGMMQEDSHFFAVGAGHLGGKNGVLALLRKEGYSVVRVEE